MHALGVGAGPRLSKAELKLYSEFSNSDLKTLKICLNSESEPEWKSEFMAILGLWSA